MENIEKIFRFASLIDSLKYEKRYKSIDNFDGDTVGSHSWRLAVLSFVVAQELKLDIDILKAVKIALTHDLPEAITGDLDAKTAYENNDLKIAKEEKEKKAIEKIKDTLSPKMGNEIKDLWLEYSEAKTKESRYVAALDKTENMYTILVLGYEYFDNFDFLAEYSKVGYMLYPDLKPVLDYIRKKLKEEFKKADIPWKKEYEI